MESRAPSGRTWNPAISAFAALLLFVSVTRAFAAAPNITSALTASGTVGAAFSYQIATDTSPTSFNAVILPAGLSVDTNSGIISGTPISAGTANVAISATDGDGTGTAALVLTINAAAPVITSSLTASATAGTAFSYQITAANSPTSFNAAGLPAGLSVNTSNGLISGTPSSGGTSSITLSAANAGGTGTATLVLTTINPPAPVITSALAASGTSGAAFSYQIAATNLPTSFNAAGLPAGLGVNTINGLISGTPISSATSSVAISAANAGGTGTAALVLTINPPAPVITSPLTATGTPGAAFSYQITATNSPTSFSAVGLPVGLNISTGGIISGIPILVATNSVAISATNATGTGTAALVLTINPLAPVITSALTSAGKVGAAFSYQITATNSPTSFNAANLPAGLSVNTSNGVISGTPISAGTSNAAVSAANVTGTGAAALVLTINPLTPVITSALTASGKVGAAFSYQITAANSPTSFNAANLPAGLSVNTSNGVISGIPTSAGTGSAVVSAANATGTGTAALVLTINPLAPIITSPLTASGTVGAAFSYQIAAANSPTSFNAANLPAGFSINTSSGVISGTPTSPGTNNIAISAANVSGTGAATLIFSVTVPSSGGTAAADTSEIRVYPIPYRPGSGNPDLGGGNTGIIFDRLPASASIKIHTLSGQLVTSFDASAASGQFNWDARNGSGRDVASGLYIAVITSPSSKTVTKKILIIR